jgi:hypothetical protein
MCIRLLSELTAGLTKVMKPDPPKLTLLIEHVFIESRGEHPALGHARGTGRMPSAICKCYISGHSHLYLNFASVTGRRRHRGWSRSPTPLGAWGILFSQTRH